MSIECKILNTICLLLYRSEYWRFTKPIDLSKVQNAYLKQTLRRNKKTDYGKKYGFESIQSYEEFAKKVPLTIYEDYEPYIEKIANGGKNVLTKDTIQLFELTSGSSGGKKLIPYTTTLKNEFQRGIRTWLYDIYSRVDGVKEGKSYWSITPVTAGKQYTKAGIPIGFEEDAEYFGWIEQAIMRRLFAVDGSVKFSGDMNKFYMDTCRQLLECDELTLISVWNPTFLTILCDFIRDHTNELISGLPVAEKERILNAAYEERFDKVFPNLCFISCWADGSASDYVESVRRRFPNVLIEPKGLLATEAFVSFPLIDEEGSRLSIYSHFYEFKNLADGRILTVDKLEKGEYELILTTGGGFYRYCLGDIIEVLEINANHPPRIRFLRRKGIACDYFGEKLTEEFVRQVFVTLGITKCFSMLAFEKDRYFLYTEAENIDADMLDYALCKNYHYEYCRQLGQLKKAGVFKVSHDAKDRYIERLSSLGMRIGDIKPAYLSRLSDWKNWF